MTFLPLVERELRARARRRSTFRVRLGAAVAAIAMAVFMLLAAEWVFAPGDVGKFLFYALGIAAFAYCLLEGVRTTADALSEEKRSGTLGLLFLTDLRGYDVVLGKLAASSLNSLYSLLAIFPALAIPLVLGGITGGEFWRLVLMLANTLWLSLAAGLFASSISYHDRKAGLATLSLLVGLTFLPPLIPSFLGGGTILGVTTSPLLAFVSLPDARYAVDSTPYWNAMVGMQVVAWGFVALASAALPRSWRTGAAPLPRSRAKRRDNALAETAAGFNQVRLRRQLLDIHPALWLAQRQFGSSKPIWILVLGFGCLCILLQWTFNHPAGLFAGALGLHLLLAVWAASDSCHALSGARDSGVMELLLSTPLQPDPIIRGYQQALGRKFFQPILALATVEAVVLIAHAVVMGLEEEDPLAGLIVFGFVGFTLGVSMLDVLAASRFGLWMGMNDKRPMRATAKTVVFSLILPVVPALCCGFLWPVIGLIKNILFIQISQDRLRRNFRGMVLEQYSGGDTTAASPPTFLEKRRAGRKLPSVLPPDPRGR